MSDAFSVTNKGYAGISGIGSLLLTWAAMTAVLAVGDQVPERRSN